MIILAALVLWQTRTQQGPSSLPPSPQTAAASRSQNNSVVVAPASSQAVATSAPAPVSSDSISAFENWAHQYAAASANDRAAMLTKGEEFARARHAEMAALIRKDPEQAIARALPYSLRKELPANILGEIEYPVSSRGDFRPIYYKPLPGRESEVPPTAYEVTINKEKYETFTFGGRLIQPAHNNAYVHGVAITELAAKKPNTTLDLEEEKSDRVGTRLLALNAKPARKLAPDESRALARKDAYCGISRKPLDSSDNTTFLQFAENYYSFCDPGHADQFNEMLGMAHNQIWASHGGGDGEVIPTIGNPGAIPTRPRDQGIFKLLYIRVSFADDPVPPQSDDGAYATVQGNNRYFNEGSYGTVWWETKVTPIVRLPQRKHYYGEKNGALLSDAVTGAAALGYFLEGSFYYVLCNTMPQYDFGGISSGILNGSPGALSHELGHNFGLPHANFWQPEGRVLGPPQLTNNYPIDPDSLIGHNDINAPFPTSNTGGEPSQEYGNQHDVMGSGPGHFSAMFKNRMNWLPDNFIHHATSSSTNRLYAFDTPHISEGRIYAIRGHKDYQKEFWISYRQGFPDNQWFSNGVEVDWNLGVNSRGFGTIIGNNVMLDTTPDTTHGKQDAALVVGRTLRDTAADIFITPVAIGGGPDAWDKWIDVVVERGPFRDNQPPTVSMEASALTVSTGAVVSFTATAQDPDGNSLAYYWDFGDYSFGTNGPVQSKQFVAPGRYVVRCEVSDLKGGVASAHVVVVVGNPTTYTISGRVLDIYGNPVQGVRVHNSGVKPATPAPVADGTTTNTAVTNIGTYRYGYTDSQGYYIIGNIPPGTYTNRAFAFGYRIEPLNFTDPVVLDSGNANGLDFTATPLTRVRIDEVEEAIEGGEGHFTIRREGDISEDLPVRFNLSGSAVTNVDYTISPINVTTNGSEFVIPAGSDSIDLIVSAPTNGVGSGNKTIVLTLQMQPTQTRITTILTNVLITNGNIYFTNTMLVDVTNRYTIPGWELRPSGPTNAQTWFQTDPTYVLDSAEARLDIVDIDPPRKPSVGVIALNDAATEARGDSATFIFYRQGAPLEDELLISYSLSGSASNGIDYLPMTGKVVIPAGRDYALVYLSAINDLFVENTETILLTIQSNTNSYNIDGPSAQAVILDDDLPLINIFASDSTAIRGGGGGRVTFSRAGSLENDLLVNYVVSGTAVSGIDFAALPGSVTIPAGSLDVQVPISALASSPNALPRTVNIRIADSTTYNIYNDNSATVTLIDGDLPTVTLSTSATTVNENNSSVSFIVTRAGNTNGTFTNSSLNVFFEVGGSAWEGFDYGAIGTNIVIPAGQVSASIVVNTINDNAREFGDVVGQETITIQLRPGAGYRLGGTTDRTVRIIDDENDQALPSVGFMLSSSTVREDAGTANLFLKVSANPATNKPIQMEYRVIGGSAVAGVNYENSFQEGTNATFSTTGLVNITHYFAPNPRPPMTFFITEENTYVIPIRILNDNLAAGNKTVIVSLFNSSRFQTNTSVFTNSGTVFTNVLITRIPTNAYVGPSVTHTLTILDVGQVGVSITALTNAISEGGPPSAFKVTRTGPTNGPLTIPFAVSGSAANGNDFVLGAANTITIPAGTNAAYLSILAVDDPTEELVENVVVTLLPRAGFGVEGPLSASMDIISDDGTVQFSVSSYEIPEEVGVYPVPVFRSAPTNTAVAVDYVYRSGTASNGVDFLGTNGTLFFAPNEIVKYINIPIVNDTLVETNKTFSLSLTNPTGGVQLGGQKIASLTIISDDRDFNFALPSFRVPENRSTGEVVITRRGAIGQFDTVTFIASNAAAGNLDFVATNVVVEFLPGETNRSVFVEVLDDDLFEGDEGIALSLISPSAGAQLGQTNQGTLLIVDDESKLDFEVAAYSVPEYSNFVALIVRRTGGTVNPVTVDYTTADVTATNGFDFIGGTGTITFEGEHFGTDTNGSGVTSFIPGESVKVFLIPIIDDVIGEGNERFTVTLSNPLGPIPGSFPASTLLGSNVTAQVTILDNELPGFVDYEFVSGPNGPVHSVSIAPRGGLEEFAGRVVIGGEFTQVDGNALNRVARLLPNGLLDLAFNPGVGANGTAYVVSVQMDGKVLLGGDFTMVDGTNRIRVARLNADGHVDLSFNPGAAGVNGAVRAIAVQTNGQIIIGGDFTQVAGTNHSRIARLNANGSRDTNFNAAVNATVRALAIQPDGKILVGGDFGLVNNSSRGSIVRLNVDGSIDGTFNTGSGFAGSVYALAVQPDGSIVAGGNFTGFNGSTVRYVARLNNLGTRDSSFNSGGSGPNAQVNTLGLATGGKIVIGGAFTSVNGQPRNFFARLTGTGSLDSTFRIGTGANALVRSLVVQPDSATVIGGDFTMVGGVPRNYVARIHGDERFEILGVEFSALSFQIPEDGGSALITVQRVGNTNLAFTADFTTANGSATAPSDYASTNGTISFLPGELSHTFSVSVFNDALVEGNETVSLLITNASAGVDLTGITSASLIIIDSAKTISFATNSYVVPEAASNVLITVVRGGDLGGTVSAQLITVSGFATAGYDFVGVTNTVVLTNGQASVTVPVLIIDDSDDEPAETFTVQLAGAVGGFLVTPLEATVMILDNDLGPGFPDVAFDAGVGGSRFVRSLALQADGRLMVGGAFTNFANSNLNFAARLRANGTVDPTFTPGTGPNGLVSRIGVSADGHISLAGAFTRYNGGFYTNLVRLNTNGLIDIAYTSPMVFNAAVDAMSMLPDGRMFVGGGFDSPVSRYGRIRANGTLDLQFDPGIGADAPVVASALQSDGKVLIGGSFTNVAGVYHPGLARLGTNGVMDSSFAAISLSNGTVFAVASAPDGKVLIGGSFHAVNGVPRRGIARLNANGTLDTSFAPVSGVNGNVYTVSIFKNGWVFIGGDFTSVNGVTQNRYALLHDDGVVEDFFGSSIGADNVVYASLITPDQKIYIGGDFTMVGGLIRRGVARLNADVLRLGTPRIVSNAVRMTLNSVAGSTYVLESSSDLLYWIPLSTNVATGAGLEFTDVNVSANSMRFYRARRFGP